MQQPTPGPREIVGVCPPTRCLTMIGIRSSSDQLKHKPGRDRKTEHAMIRENTNEIQLLYFETYIHDNDNGSTGIRIGNRV